jgi:hypothetical protein
MMLLTKVHGAMPSDDAVLLLFAMASVLNVIVSYH